MYLVENVYLVETVSANETEVVAPLSGEDGQYRRKAKGQYRRKAKEAAQKEVDGAEARTEHERGETKIVIVTVGDHPLVVTVKRIAIGVEATGGARLPAGDHPLVGLVTEACPGDHVVVRRYERADLQADLLVERERKRERERAMAKMEKVEAIWAIVEKAVQSPLDCLVVLLLRLQYQRRRRLVVLRRCR